MVMGLHCDLPARVCRPSSRRMCAAAGRSMWGASSCGPYSHLPNRSFCCARATAGGCCCSAVPGFLVGRMLISWTAPQVVRLHALSYPLQKLDVAQRRGVLQTCVAVGAGNILLLRSFTHTHTHIRPPSAKVPTLGVHCSHLPAITTPSY